MIIKQNGTTSIITQEKTSNIELIKKIQALYPKFKNNNIIVMLSSINNLTLPDILEFSQLSKTHKSTNQSFVIVSKSIDLDCIPDTLAVAPTLQEAYDLIEMEAMERDLGF